MFTSNLKEDKELFSRVDDIVSLASIRNKPLFLGFLNEREVYIIKDYLSWNSENISFYGGYDNANRMMLCCYNNKVDHDDFPIKEVCFKFRKVDKLTHRDFLGALMSLGIDRSCIGDILVGEGMAVCYVKTEIYDYVVSQASKIGRVGVTIVEKCNINYHQEKNYVEHIVSSLRLDVIVASLTNLSRSKTNTLILSGKVNVNYSQNQNFSYNLKQGDILTIRGYGKFIINEILGVTKKERIKLLIEQFR